MVSFCISSLPLRRRVLPLCISLLIGTPVFASTASTTSSPATSSTMVPSEEQCLSAPSPSLTPAVPDPVDRNAALLAKIEDTLDAEHKKCPQKFSLAASKKWPQAASLTEEAHLCPHLTTFVNWQFYLHYLSPPAIQKAIAFLEKHPIWPWRGRLEEKVIEQIDGLPGWTPQEQDFIMKRSMTRYSAARTLCRKNAGKCHHFLNFWRQGEGTQKDFDQMTPKMRSTVSNATFLQRSERLFWRGEIAEAQKLLDAKKQMKDLGATGLRQAITLLAESSVALLEGPTPAAYEKSPALRYAYARLAFLKEHRTRFFWILKGLNRPLPHGDKWSRILYATVLDLVAKGRPALAVGLLKNLSLEHTAVSDDLHVLTALVARFELNQPSRALKILQANEKRIKSPLSLSRTWYWQGIMHECRGHNAAAHRAFRQASHHRHTYYGQIAARKLGVPLRLPPIALLTDQGEKNLKPQEAYLMHLALLSKDLGQVDASLAFLQMLTNTFGKTPAQKKFLMAMCLTHLPQAQVYTTHRLGLPIWPKQNQHESMDDGMGEVIGLEESYPLFYHDTITRHLDHYGAQHVSLPIVLAVIRRESAFNPYAISPAGAEGLMQFMPGTAAEIAKNDPYFKNKQLDLSNEDMNIRLGVQNLKRLYTQYNGNIPMVFAAYNAGPRKMDEWAERWGAPPTDDEKQAYTIERFSYEETRTYVKNIMAGAALYAALVKRPSPKTLLVKNLREKTVANKKYH